MGDGGGGGGRGKSRLRPDSPNRMLSFARSQHWNNVNPFTAMLAAPSLGKRPIKVPNLKSLSFFPPFA